jgi:hypothetical protein
MAQAMARAMARAMAQALPSSLTLYQANDIKLFDIRYLT